jgi:hypothetical protein
MSEKWKIKKKYIMQVTLNIAKSVSLKLAYSDLIRDSSNSNHRFFRMTCAGENGRGSPPHMSIKAGVNVRGISY